ncbi:S41 family peptidase [Candidatus Microgenomates bacterium]|nr:S41 family peptidase [Candidatus Microgenomates bacterium]
MTLKQIRKIIIVIALILLAGGTGWCLNDKLARHTPYAIHQDDKADLALFWDVWARLEEGYLDKDVLDKKTMVYGAIKGMTQSLGDPYTVFLEPGDNKRAKEDLNGSFEGVGIQLGYKDKRLAVIAPLKGTPAEKAGVKAGDLILKIKDEEKEVDQETTGISLPEAVNLIRGPRGHPVILTLFSEGEEKSHDVEIIRGTIIVLSVEVEFIKEVAYLKLMKFGDRTEKEWNEAVSSIISHRPSVMGVVLDVRNNPGGYLKGAVFTASEFLSSGVVVKQEGKEEVETYEVNRKGKLLTLPLVVLINEGSASASEIAAGCLRDYGRAKTVGERTFGKGTVQEAQELPGGAGLHITTARWLLPLGSWIGEKGIEPDFLVELDEEREGDEQLEKAIEILTQ